MKFAFFKLSDPRPGQPSEINFRLFLQKIELVNIKSNF